MSNAILKGNASGTGSVTLESPNTNSDRTIALPDSDGTVMVSGNMPAFSAGNSGVQSLTGSTFTKVLFQTEVFDTNNNFASSTFTPTVAGYYQINGCVNLQVSAAITRGLAMIYKNGVEFTRGVDVPSSVYGLTVSTVVYCNGTTDYIEIYTYAAGTTLGVSNNLGTQFSGSLVRGA